MSEYETVILLSQLLTMTTQYNLSYIRPYQSVNVRNRQLDFSISSPQIKFSYDTQNQWR